MKDIRLIPATKLTIAIFCIAITLAACSGETAVDPQELGDPEMGEELFKDEARTQCVGCHTVDGRTHRSGPTLLGISEVAGERVPDLSAVEYVRQSILNPQAYIVEGFEDVADEMRTYTFGEPDENGHMEQYTITEEDLNNLIAFVLTH